jgi:protocatechuate 3,4-dioxygenase beta subunit
MQGRGTRVGSTNRETGSVEIDSRPPSTLGRRRVLFGLGALVLAAGGARVADVFGRGDAASAQEPSIDALGRAQLALTPAQTEGPYFRPGSPETSSLAGENMAGTPLTVMGQVLTTDGQPVAGALLDFWQADDSGQYDNRGYAFRGHQYADASGQYTLQTVLPGLYPGRTRHIHVKVQPPGGRVLTTQLYVPDDPRNARDGLYNAVLQMTMQQNADGTHSAIYTFVVAVG